MNNREILSHIEQMNLSPTEVRELITNLIMKERVDARKKVTTYIELVIATLRICGYEHMNLVSDAEVLLYNVKEANDHSSNR